MSDAATLDAHSRSTRYLALAPFAALLRRDLQSAARVPSWWWTLWLPLCGTAYLIVLLDNAHCDARCRDGAALIVATLCSGSVAALLAALHRVQGTRLLVPDRVVPTRLRLASLFVVAVAPSLPFALVLAWLTREPALLPHVASVTLVVLLLRLREPPRPSAVGPMLWLLVPATALLVISPPLVRLASSALFAITLVVLLDRRACRLRRWLMAGGGSAGGSR